MGDRNSFTNKKVLVEFASPIIVMDRSQFLKAECSIRSIQHPLTRWGVHLMESLLTLDEK